VVERRSFIQAVAVGGVATLAGLTPVATSRLRADNSTTTNEKPEKPAESLIKELYAGLSDAQKKRVVLPWDSKERLRMSFNRALNRTTIGDVYTKAQRGLRGRGGVPANQPQRHLGRQQGLRELRCPHFWRS
jgi:hypothetical protein